jgi:hypothetical protein
MTGNKEVARKGGLLCLLPVLSFRKPGPLLKFVRWQRHEDSPCQQ